MTAATPSTTQMSRAERVALCDTLAALGPVAPTLCEGWTTRDLAAHLVMRERRPDALPGISAPPLAGYTARVQAGIAARPYDDLVGDLRAGPPLLSVWRVPGGQGVPTLLEFLVHHEDARRGQDGWQLRPLGTGVEDVVWRQLSRIGRVLYRKARVGVVLRRPGGDEVRVRSGESTVTVTGTPLEQLLYAFGRTSATEVTVDGSPEDVRVFERTPLGA
jgi:uncharacterized protein (TIGR03085 family)